MLRRERGQIIDMVVFTKQKPQAENLRLLFMGFPYVSYPVFQTLVAI